MIVRERQDERRARVDRHKTEGHQRAIGRKRHIQRAFDFALKRLQRLVAAVDDVERCMPRSSGIFVALPRCIERQAGETEVLELAVDQRRQARLVERTVDPHRMHGVVRMQRSPAQHRRLKQIEPALHCVMRVASSRRCALKHQFLFTLYQMSAA